MVFPKRKSAASNQTKKPAEPAKARHSLFKRKIVDAPQIAPESINRGLSRALRSAKMPSKSYEDAVSDTENVRSSLVAIEAVLYAMDRVRETITECLEIVESAALTEDLGGRALLAEKYDESRLSLDQIADETDEAGVDLIKIQGGAMSVEITGCARYSIAGFCVGTEEHALNLPPPLTAFADSDEIEHTKLLLETALARVTRATTSYCKDAKFLMTRIAELNKKLTASDTRTMTPAQHAHAHQTAAE